MKTVQVVFSVKKDHIAEFMNYTMTNAINSRKKNGVILFHYYQVLENTTTFILLAQ